VGARDLDKVTALHVAAYFGHCDVLRTLKELGAGYWRSEKEMRGNNDRDPFRPLSLEELDVRSPPSPRVPLPPKRTELCRRPP
jgi:hypothetical protein